MKLSNTGGYYYGLFTFIHGTLWLFNIAMENGPFIDGLPMKHGWVFRCFGGSFKVHLRERNNRPGKRFHKKTNWKDPPNF